MTSIEQAWQKRWSWALVLLPLTGLYYLIVQLRRLLFRYGVFNSTQPPVPLIVVGNISAGGNGKTPVVIWLCELLKRQGYKPAVVSRGYGGKAEQYPLVVSAGVDTKQSGDEPKLIANRLGITVVVDPLRVRAVQKAHSLGANVIVSDDGMQHYQMGRTIEIAVVDGERRHGNGLLLPSGPLREPKSRLNAVFAVICNGGEPLSQEYPMTLVPAKQWFSVLNPDVTCHQNEFINQRTLAVAGIGNPQRFFDLVKSLGIKADNQPLADHAPISEQTLAAWRSQYDVVLMTEKDAVKCTGLDAQQCYFLPVDAQVDPELEQLILAEL